MLRVIEADRDDFSRRHRQIDLQVAQRENSAIEFQPEPEGLFEKMDLVTAEFAVSHRTVCNESAESAHIAVILSEAKDLAQAGRALFLNFSVPNSKS